MARKQRRFFFEPWVASRCRSWESAFRFGPPKHGETPADVAQNVADWESQRIKAEKNADWVIWGSKMSEPCETTSLMGVKGFHDGKGIIAIRRKLGLPDGSVTHEDICKRIVECVNAMSGVVDPMQFIADVRALLMELAREGCVEDPRTDPRIVNLASRCIPPEQLEKFGVDQD